MPEVSLHNPGVAPVPSRFTSIELADFLMPRGCEGAWRLIPIDHLEGLLADTLDGGVPIYQLIGKPLNLGQSIISGAAMSALAPHESDILLVAAPFDCVAAVGWNNIRETMRATTNGHAPQPMFLDVHAGEPGSVPVVGHLEIVAREGCDATLVLCYTGSGQLNETVEILVERRATLRVLSLQEWEADAKHIATHQLRLAEGSTIQHVVVTFGGNTVRICSGMTLPESHADINMFGLYFTNAGTYHEQWLFIDRIAAGSKSRATYKGALQGQDAHVVQVGDMGIGPVAYATDSYESNRNLVLGRGPCADSVPNLEIYSGQIESAGYVLATGRFDDEQLFYLMSYGIAPAEVKHLVVKAFYAGLLSQMDVPEPAAYVLELVNNCLNEGSLQ